MDKCYLEVLSEEFGSDMMEFVEEDSEGDILLKYIFQSSFHRDIKLYVF